MFERFTGRARHVVVLSQEEARRLQHNYIGTEHILLGLLGEPEGVACRALVGMGMSLADTRSAVLAIVSSGKKAPSGHIPFTPRAKKVLEFALREALQLNHNYIGTEHILLGLIREGDGVAAQVLRQHGDLLAIRLAVLDLVNTSGSDALRGRRWLRRRGTASTGEGNPQTPAEQAVLNATPAADTTLSEAARLAAPKPVGSHHLLLAALADSDSAAARALAALGVDLDQAKEALRGADITGTSDELPEEAGRRQMVLKVSDGQLILTAADPAIIAAAWAALDALGDRADAGTIAGALPECAALSDVWQSLNDALVSIKERATPPTEPTGGPESQAA